MTEKEVEYLIFDMQNNWTLLFEEGNIYVKYSQKYNK